MIRATNGLSAGEDTMLAVLFAVIVLLAITIYYVAVERPRERAAAAVAKLAGPASLEQAMGLMPPGVFLQPTYTWGRITTDGEILLGVHPLLLSLVGRSFRVELPEAGTQVRKGEPLLWIGKGNRRLAVRSPLSGRIREVQELGYGDASWEPLHQRGGGWLCRLEPEGVEDEVPTWMIGDSALRWTRHTCSAIRDHLQRARAERHLGFAMADGGELPVGILDEFDAAEWRAFQDTFLGN